MSTTEAEIVAKLKASYDLRGAGEAMVAQADADEAAIDTLIAECGYDTDTLVRKAYDEDDED
jgi:hypothetical protein